MYEVSVSNIGFVYTGDSEARAEEEFEEYVFRSKRGLGRAAGEDVTLWKDGKIVREFVGSLSEA